MTESELPLLHIPDFHLSSYYTRSNHLGGGVMILTQKNIKNKRILMPAIQALLTEKEFECCLSEVSMSDFTFVLGCIYRSPLKCLEDSFLSKFEILCSILSNKYKHIVLTGDYNINVLKRDKLYHKFNNILKIHNLTYRVNFPTRVTHESESAIDNVISNIEDSECRVTGLITHISDHDAQLFEIFGLKTKKKKKNYQKIL